MEFVLSSNGYVKCKEGEEVEMGVGELEEKSGIVWLVVSFFKVVGEFVLFVR